MKALVKLLPSPTFPAQVLTNSSTSAFTAPTAHLTSGILGSEFCSNTWTVHEKVTKGLIDVWITSIFIYFPLGLFDTVTTSASKLHPSSLRHPLPFLVSTTLNSLFRFLPWFFSPAPQLKCRCYLNICTYFSLQGLSWIPTTSTISRYWWHRDPHQGVPSHPSSLDLLENYFMLPTQYALCSSTSFIIHWHCPNLDVQYLTRTMQQLLTIVCVFPNLSALNLISSSRNQWWFTQLVE